MIGAELVEEREALLEMAIGNDRRAATRFALELISSGRDPADLIVDALGPVQIEVGWRWQNNLLSVGEEHTATGVIDHVLAAVAIEARPRRSGGVAVVACAEGDWHALPARMAAELLTLRGWKVTFLGTATPADQLDRYLEASPADLVVISCAVPLYFDGARHAAQVATARRVPVAVGGAAVTGEARSVALGATCFATDLGSDFEPVDGSRWTGHSPGADPELTRARAALAAERSTLVARALDELERRSPAARAYSEPHRRRTVEDLQYIVSFIDAALAVDDATVFTDFAEWLQLVLTARGVPDSMLALSVEVIREVAPASFERVRETLQLGIDRLRRPAA